MVADTEFMQHALALARRGLGHTSPNPAVGCVIVSADGVVVGKGYHERAGGPHAEIVALGEAGPRARGATLYCSLEPCAHTGRTGPCVAAIVEAGVGRVVAAIEDPNPRVAGRGLEYLRAHGVDVSVGVCRHEAARLNAPFFTSMITGRPFVTMKIATSADGRVAARRGEPTKLTCAESDRDVHRLRAEIDAIAVGSETVLVDDPLLTARGEARSRPLTRVIVDWRLRVPPSARVFSTLEAGPVVVVVSEQAMGSRQAAARELEDAGAELLVVGDRDLAEMLGALGRRNLRWLAAEGGPRLHAALTEARLVDHVRVYVTPAILGPDGVPWDLPAGFSLAALDGLTVEPCGADVIIEGYVHRTH